MVGFKFKAVRVTVGFLKKTTVENTILMNAINDGCIMFHVFLDHVRHMNTQLHFEIQIFFAKVEISSPELQFSREMFTHGTPKS